LGGIHTFRFYATEQTHNRISKTAVMIDGSMQCMQWRNVLFQRFFHTSWLYTVTVAAALSLPQA